MDRCRAGHSLPYTFKVHKVPVDIQLRILPLQKFHGAMQVRPVVLRLADRIIIKCSQAAIGATVRVQHQQNGVGAVQADGFANLVQDKCAVSFVIVSGQAFGPAGHPNRIGIHYANTLSELPEHLIKAVVKAPDNRRITFVSFPRRLKMENFPNGTPRCLII